MAKRVFENQTLVLKDRKLNIKLKLRLVSIATLHPYFKYECETWTLSTESAKGPLKYAFSEELHAKKKEDQQICAGEMWLQNTNNSTGDILARRRKCIEYKRSEEEVSL